MTIDNIALAELEETLLEAAEREAGAIARLRQLLRPWHDAPVPDKVRGLLLDNLELIAPDLAAAAGDEEIQGLMLELAVIGVDSLRLRDLLAAICRRQHASWPDPAGLIQALGIASQDTALTEARRRWGRFNWLAEGSRVWHTSYGLGRVTEIDSFSSLVYVEFARGQSFSLEQALTHLAVARPDSIVQTWSDGDGPKLDPKIGAREVQKQIAASFDPPLAAALELCEALLVPACMAKTAFDRWLKASPASAAPAAQKKRTWDQARGLEELEQALAHVDRLQPDEEQIARLAQLFRFAAGKDMYKAVFAKTLAALHGLAKDPAWLDDFVRQLPSDAVAWSGGEDFVAVAGALKAKLIPAWFALVLAAKGADAFIERLILLPHRYWVHAEELLERVEDDGDAVLEAKALDSFRHGTASADVALWLWRRDKPEVRDAFQNLSAVFRTFRTGVRGEFHKARKALHKLLMDDPEFQRNLMLGGTREGIEGFVRYVKNSKDLQKGEQQSLLVKVVRLYPEAKDIVAERTSGEARTRIPKRTSLRTHEEHRRELHEIINTKIPANSAQIARAREYGDLRENAEYKAAKEAQKLIMRRRDELERDLRLVEPTDFSDIEVADTVVLGSTVRLETAAGTDVYHLLGLWDSAPEESIISYDTPLGKKLLGMKVGESLQTPKGGEARIVAIDELPADIRAWLQPQHSS